MHSTLDAETVSQVAIKDCLALDLCRTALGLNLLWGLCQTVAPRSGLLFLIGGFSTIRQVAPPFIFALVKRRVNPLKRVRSSDK